MPREPRDVQQDAVVEEAARSREERAQAFAAYLKERLIDWQYRSRTWVTSATELGKMLGVSDVTANDWLKGKTLPRREHCVRIASAFGVPMTEVLEAAGYPVTQDDSYNSYAALLAAVDQQATWPQEKREHVRQRLIDAISPTFSAGQSAAEWRELATLILHQKSPATSKAEKIAHIVELWQQEVAQQ